MVLLFVSLITALAVGFLSKLTDVQVDEKRFFYKNLKFATGLAYGLLYALAMSFGVELATLFLGIAIAVLLAGKVNSKAHQFAIAGFLAAIAFFGFPKVDFVLLSGFVLFAIVDEFLNDYFDVRQSKGILPEIAKYRLSLEAFSLAVSAYTGDWIYFAAILAFDLGYLIAEKVSSCFALSIPGSFGTHLVLDLQDCPASKLSSRKFALAFLSRLPAELGMRKISRPVVREVKTPFDEGLSGFVMLAESHVSVHTFPKFHSAHVDVFSCKPFDAGKAKEKIGCSFSAKYSVSRVFDRMGEANG